MFPPKTDNSNIGWLQSWFYKLLIQMPPDPNMQAHTIQLEKHILNCTYTDIKQPSDAKG